MPKDFNSFIQDPKHYTDYVAPPSQPVNKIDEGI